MYLDSNGLIVQKDMDGGDSAQRMGFFYCNAAFRYFLGLPAIIYKDLADPGRVFELLVTPAGLIRNPVKWNDPKDCSRDQTRPMMIMAGLYLSYTGVIPVLKPKGILGRYPNGDIASPENWNEYNRAIGEKPSLLGELWHYASVVLHCWKTKKNKDDVGDDLNMLLTSVYFYLVQPTAISTAALRYYLVNRPDSFGTDMFLEWNPVLAALKWYFRPKSGGNPELADIWKTVLQELKERLCIK